MFGTESPDWRPTKASRSLEVLADEFKEIHGRDPAGLDAIWPGRKDEKTEIPAGADRAFYEDVHLLGDRSALCLSGGGIRSAAFGLGVIQWLSGEGFLDQFHYLSTVSGGGYIGSWLSAWIAKEPGGWTTVRKRLSWDQARSAEPSELRHLRENCKYLTRRGGILSGDSWSAFAIVARNLLLNWSIILPVLVGMTIVPKMMALVPSVGMAFQQAPWYPAAIVALSSYAVAVSFTVESRPRWASIDRGYRHVRIWLLIPLIVSAFGWLFVVALAPLPGAADAWSGLLAGLPTPAAALLARSVGIVGLPPSFVVLEAAYILLLTAIYAGAFARAHFRWRSGNGKVAVYVAGGSRIDIHGVPHMRYRIALSAKARGPVTVDVRTEDRQAVASQHYVDRPPPPAPGQPVNPDLERVTIPDGQDGVDYDVRLLKTEIERDPIKRRDIRLLLRNASPGVSIGWSPSKRRFRLEMFGTLLSGFAVATALAAGHYVFGSLYDSLTRMSLFRIACFAIPGALGAHLAGSLAFIGATSRLPKSEGDREWYGRADGMILAIMAVWVIALLLTILLPEVVNHLLTGSGGVDRAGTWLGGVAAAAGSLAAWLGHSPVTPALGRSAVKSATSRIALPIAGVLAVASLLAALSVASDRLFFGEPFLDALSDAGGSVSRLALIMASWMGLVVSTAWILGSLINVNRFSLHSVYRNRLVRAFLGASKDRYREGRLDRFTGFNDADNIELQRLWDRSDPDRTRANWRPFHVINIALNVLAPRDLSLKERKAVPFVATPLWCGSSHLTEQGAFRRSSEFGGEDKTITVGTAMAISGAAVSPNMGYHSSPLVTLLLTMFNVRLGWWYGNPRNAETYRLEGPRSALLPLAYEAFGMTDKDKPYVYLSDGGHFENLGLYEMVRRRCHFILVSDAGHDPGCMFEDLSNAVGRIKVDFGIPVTFEDLSGLRARNGDRTRPEAGGDGFAFGIIDYPAVDGPHGRQGLLLYVKPGFRGDEPAQVLGYAARHPDFPHESTMDQWFTDAQFESYRALGFETLKRLFGRTGLKTGDGDTLSMLFKTVQLNVAARNASAADSRR